MCRPPTAAYRTPAWVTRLSDEPVVDPADVPGYGAVFNAGLIVQDGEYHLFARGVRARPLKELGKSDVTGTQVVFKPDAKIFSTTEIDPLKDALGDLYLVNK